MNIDLKYKDTDIVYKFECGNDLPHRMSELQNKYKDIINCDLRMKLYSYVDPMYKFNAENDIRNLMNVLKSCFEYKTENESVILSKDEYESVKNHYELIKQQKEYQHKYKHLQDSCDKEILKKDLLISEIEGDLSKKDDEMSQMKISMMTK